MYSLTFLEKAKREWIDSALYYEIQKEGLGIRFSETLLKQLTIIQKSPELYQKKKKEYREAPASPFPFIIVYRIDKTKKTVVVMAIFHTKRKPKRKYTKK